LQYALHCLPSGDIYLLLPILPIRFPNRSANINLELFIRFVPWELPYTN
jgi:hypothetical protein